MNEDKEYKGSNTSDYSRLQSQVKKLTNKKRKCDNKLLVERNMRLVKELKEVKLHLQRVMEQRLYLQEKLDKCDCASSRKRKITHLQPKKITKSKHDPVDHYY